VLLFLNPCVAFAAGVTFDTTFRGVSLLSVSMVLILSTVFGLAALLNLLKDGTPPRLPAFIAAHMVTAIAAGMASFVFSEYYELNDWLEVGIIMLTSYGGVRFLDLGRDHLFSRLTSTQRSSDSTPS
jgi:hypothetical protein